VIPEVCAVLVLSRSQMLYPGIKLVLDQYVSHEEARRRLGLPGR